MMTFPTEWKKNVPNHQPDTIVGKLCSASWDKYGTIMGTLWKNMGKHGKFMEETTSCREKQRTSMKVIGENSCHEIM